MTTVRKRGGNFQRTVRLQALEPTISGEAKSTSQVVHAADWSPVESSFGRRLVASHGAKTGPSKAMSPPWSVRTGYSMPSLSRKRAQHSNSPFLTVDELRDLWRCSRRHVERLLRKRAIGKIKIGRRTLISRSEAMKYSRKMRSK
jgi:excisionase family DNA binding protein